MIVVQMHTRESYQVYYTVVFQKWAHGCAPYIGFRQGGGLTFEVSILRISK